MSRVTLSAFPPPALRLPYLGDDVHGRPPLGRSAQLSVHVGWRPQRAERQQPPVAVLGLRAKAGVQACAGVKKQRGNNRSSRS